MSASKSTSTSTSLTPPKLTSVVVNGVECDEKHVVDTVANLCLWIQRYVDTGLALSFNGGKDCTVLLYLLVIACHILHIPLHRIIVIYLQIDDEFDEILEFIKQCSNTYNLTVRNIDHYQVGLTNLMQHTPISAILMGQRCGDPGTEHMQLESPSDAGWPSFMRLNPILHWTYAQVWSFLRRYSLPYCSLYDLGYTSLGDRLTTSPNPALFDHTNNKFSPAYLLKDESLERGGRHKKNSNSKRTPPCTGDDVEQKESPTTTTDVTETTVSTKTTVIRTALDKSKTTTSSTST